ncbi:hypothetical protein BDW59DRAFT_161386 [Aspergillus cavernicola]|uniref:BTB domain-containing protein n=1 Tax=Aspergillus cavernicola TaxID=176166 RepID=A0ABR4IE14_9EURO
MSTTVTLTRSKSDPANVNKVKPSNIKARGRGNRLGLSDTRATSGKEISKTELADIIAKIFESVPRETDVENGAADTLDTTDPFVSTLEMSFTDKPRKVAAPLNSPEPGPKALDSVPTHVTETVTHVVAAKGELIIEIRGSNAPFAAWLDPEIFRPAQSQQKTKESESVSEDTVTYRVSATHMKFASPIFQDLFTATHDCPPQKIVVRGWDPRALLITLNVIHCKNNDIPRRVSLELLANITVCATMFGCREALGFVTDTWAQPMRVGISLMRYSRDLMLWLWISWTLGFENEWREAAKIAMEQSFGPVSSFGVPIPEHVLCQINAAREAAIKGIVELTHKTYKKWFDEDKPCSPRCNWTMIGLLATCIRASHLFPKPRAPFLDHSYEELIVTWGFVIEDSSPANKPCECYRTCFEEMRNKIPNVATIPLSR